MYEELYIDVILFSKLDVVRTSDNWSDGNVDDDGWT